MQSVEPISPLTYPRQISLLDNLVLLQPLACWAGLLRTSRRSWFWFMNWSCVTGFIDSLAVFLSKIHSAVSLSCCSYTDWMLQIGHKYQHVHPSNAANLAHVSTFSSNECCKSGTSINMLIHRMLQIGHKYQHAHPPNAANRAQVSTCSSTECCKHGTRLNKKLPLTYHLLIPTFARYQSITASFFPWFTRMSSLSIHIKNHDPCFSTQKT